MAGTFYLENCMSYSTIIALDLGKFKTVGCVMAAASREHTFETSEMSPPAIEAHAAERR